MNQEVKAKWVAALRSGEFEQNKGALTNADRTKHCCLGVLCELAIGEGIIPGPVNKDKGQGSLFYYGQNYDGKGGDAFVLPSAVQVWAETDVNPKVPKPLGADLHTDMCGLANYNDGYEISNIRPHTFNEIADVIEENL
jgi:hypothetical protein